MAWKKPSDYDSVQTGGYKTLPAGGYICRIINAEECESSTGKPMLKFIFDICDGEYTSYFMDQFNDRKAAAEHPNDVKWPFNGTKWILLLNNEGKTNRDFKSFCTAVEESGTTVWVKDTFDAKRLKDAQVGIIFRNEENEYNDKYYWRAVPFFFRSVEAIEKGDFQIPKDKPISKPTLPSPMGDIPDNFSAAEDDIPF